MLGFMKSGNNRTAGSAASWAVGATLGAVLGLGLLIAGPRLIPGAATANVTETTPAGRTAETPSEAAPTPATETLEGSATTNETSASDGAAGQAGTAEGSAGTSTQAAGEGAATAENETAAGGPSGDEAVTAEGNGSTVQEDTASSATPGTEVQANAEAGQTVFASNCAACHGQNGGGAIGPALNEAASWNLAEFTGALREGKTPVKTLNATMPRYSEAQISNQQLADLHAYVQTLR